MRYYPYPFHGFKRYRPDRLALSPGMNSNPNHALLGTNEQNTCDVIPGSFGETTIYFWFFVVRDSRLNNVITCHTCRSINA